MGTLGYSFDDVAAMIRRDRAFYSPFTIVIAGDHADSVVPMINIEVLKPIFAANAAAEADRCFYYHVERVGYFSRFTTASFADREAYERTSAKLLEKGHTMRAVILS